MKELIKKIPFIYVMIKKIWNPIKVKKAESNFRRLIENNRPIRFVVGASGVFESNWIPSDIEYFNILHKENWKRYFEQSSIDAILSEHMWEHLTLEEGVIAANNCYAYLKPGGNLRIAVPDGFHPDENYIEQVKVGGSGAGADDHKVLYTYKSLSSLFEQAGFKVTLLEYFDEHGKFHAKDWDVLHGKIRRSARFDERNENHKLNYTSIVLDAKK
jgi:predicted SAM-dependent methyltransferase